MSGGDGIEGATWVVIYMDDLGFAYAGLGRHMAWRWRYDGVN